MMRTVTDYTPADKEISKDGSVSSLSISPILTLIAEKIGEQRFDRWFGQETQCSCNEEKVIFYVRNHFAIHSIRQYCKEAIDDAVQSVCGEDLPVEFLVIPQHKSAQTSNVVVPSIPVPIQAADTSPLGALFKKPIPNKVKQGRRFASLTTFLEGLSNRMACHAANFAVQFPGKMNPLYLFGPTSVGKTHLLEGIWSAVRKSSPRSQPLYMTAEQFLSSFIDTIRSGALPDRNQTFRSRFKGISHLLIDDIQFFARKESTQTEFLQVIDALLTQGVQLVFSGDRPLRELPLRKELLCRLEEGLVCGIELPERELSLRICEGMIKQRELPLEPEVSRLIASRFGVHARQISGALNRLHAVYLMTNEPISLAAAEEALSDLLRLNRRDIRLQDIGKAVCETFGISEESLRSKSRIKQIATPRMLAMWLARKYTRSALSEIGLYFGNHTHSSVISAQRRIDKHLTEDAAIAEAVQKIEQALG